MKSHPEKHSLTAVDSTGGLELLWEHPEPAANDLVERTLKRLNEEKLMQPEVIRVDFRSSFAAVLGAAAAFVLAISMSFMLPYSDGKLRVGMNWSEGLEFEESYPSVQTEIHTRLEDVYHLLATLDEEALLRAEPFEDLRLEMDRLEEDWESF